MTCIVSIFTKSDLLVLVSVVSAVAVKVLREVEVTAMVNVGVVRVVVFDIEERVCDVEDVTVVVVVSVDIVETVMVTLEVDVATYNNNRNIMRVRKKKKKALVKQRQD